MASHTCLLMDASCDVPEQVLAHPQVRLLPIAVRVGSHRLLDQRDPVQTQDFYRVNLRSPSALDAGSEPPTSDEIAQFLQQHVALEFDNVLGLFVSSTRSPIFERSQPAMDRVKMNTFSQRLRA